MKATISQQTVKDWQAAIKDSHKKWRCIWYIHANHRPTMLSAVLKDNGELTEGLEEVESRWYHKIARKPLVNIEMMSSVRCWFCPLHRPRLTSNCGGTCKITNRFDTCGRW